MKRYYEAYDRRYRQIHEKGLSWSTDRTTSLVEETIRRYSLEEARMLEIGCGEGRDARYLLGRDYDVTALDISREAVDYCIARDPKHKERYLTADVLRQDVPEGKFAFIYSVACLHMLVPDEDRNRFYRYIHEHLSDDGLALVLSMGDGYRQMQSDIGKAFEDVNRIHQESQKEVFIAATSLRMVDSGTFQQEAVRNGFRVIDYGMTQIEDHFDQIMYQIIRKAGWQE